MKLRLQIPAGLLVFVGSASALLGASAGSFSLSMMKTMLVFLAATVVAMGIGIKLLGSSATAATQQRAQAQRLPSPQITLPADSQAPPPLTPSYLTIPAGLAASTTYCPRCGVANSGASFCGSCGAEIVPETTERAKPKKKSGLWPAIYDADSAREAAKAGMWSAFFCAAMTAAFTYLTTSGLNATALQMGASAYLDAVLFAGCGIGIQRMSRVAAVGALCLYVVEQIWVYDKFQMMGGIPSPMIAAFVLCFVNAVRGTFAFNRYQKTNAPVSL